MISHKKKDDTKTYQFGEIRLYRLTFVSPGYTLLVPYDKIFMQPQNYKVINTRVEHKSEYFSNRLQFVMLNILSS